MDKDTGLKWILLLVILTGQFLFISPIYAAWTIENAPSVSSNWGLFDFASYWAVGQDSANNAGVLVHFSNGSWTSVPTPDVSSNWGLSGIAFLSSDVGWAVGRDSANATGVLLQVVNGAWTSVNPPAVSSDWGLSGIEFISSTEGWIVGEDFTNKRGILIFFSTGRSTVTLPTVTTTAVSGITDTTANSGGTVTSDGGAAITAEGVCWSTSANPVVGGTCSDDGTALGSFTSNMTGMTPTTTYYVRAYATNSSGTGYGDALTFSTSTSEVLGVTTTDVSNITATTAVSGGTVTSAGGTIIITAEGVCWSTSTDATGGTCSDDGTALGSFTSTMRGLTPNTTYYVAAYASSSSGTSYGDILTFSTLPIPIANLPVVTTTDVSNITATTAVSGGTVTSDGGRGITAEGACWSTSANPVVGGTCTNDGTVVGSFTSNMTGLTPTTTYYVRAYATNSSGTGYGSNLTFSTLATPTGNPGTTTWQVAKLPNVSSDWSLSAVQRNWAVGQDFENKRGVLLRLSKSWISVNPPNVSSNWGLSGINFISSQEGWAVGQDFENKRGVLLHLSKGSWTSVDPPNVSSDWGLSGIGFVSSKEGWAVGQDSANNAGVLLHFSNGSWTSVDPPNVSSNWSLSAVGFMSANVGWAVGQSFDGTNTEGVLLRYTVPRILVSPISINYHNTAVGVSLDKTVVVKNKGNGNLILGTLTSPSPPFSIKTDSCSGESLPPLKSCKVTYEFSPDAEGTFTSSSNISSNDLNGNPMTVTLSGSGIAATSTSIHLPLR